MGAVAFFVWLGFECGRSAEQEDNDVQRRVLQEEWATLESARQVDDVLFEARQEMWDATARRRPGRRR